MGLEDPVGKVVRLWDEYDLEIIGVVKDFHFQSLHTEVKPAFFWVSPENTWNVMARIASGKEKETLASLDDLYASFNPGFTFDYKFMDVEYANMYAAELRVASLSKYFASFAVLISCLGLFGLAAFTAERRMKEIGIRKALGSSVTRIVILLSKDFTLLVILSILIGLPISYLLVQIWLVRFAYHIELSFWYFAGAGIVALLVAWLTVGFQAFKSANVNPVKCLKDE
jgi:ABC-type antimicrobial peptide transport system permease subunit